jgi:hypothetical protein
MLLLDRLLICFRLPQYLVSQVIFHVHFNPTALTRIFGLPYRFDPNPVFQPGSKLFAAWLALSRCLANAALLHG